MDRRAQKTLFGRVVLTAGVVMGVLALSALAAHAFTIILGGPTGYSAKIDVTQVGPNQLRILVQNTTTLGLSAPLPSGVSGSCPQLVESSIVAACRLLTSFGYTFNAISKNITGGSAKIASGSAGFGDPAGPPPPQTYPAGTDWSAEWGYGNNAPMDGTGNLDFISTNESHMNPFATSPNRDGPTGLDGPQGGLLSRAFSDAGPLGFVQDTLEFLVNYSAELTAADLDATWWVEFGSSGYFLCAGPDPRCTPPRKVAEPGAFALTGTALAAVLTVRRLRRRSPVFFA
jgi:hypothetical protein